MRPVGERPEDNIPAAYHKQQEVWHVDAVLEMQNVGIGSPKFQDCTYATYRVK